ncbi:MAG: FKBP-type peptidyl-prolyl cis-trans isomerase [Tessaracoccus sp.]|uniref:FKBP-type peptidyl-prolyl cis-trans isomerase n=1 Tax=Tessaracoccus sp. TaxID=1971211 RepID=UPI001EB7C887|nr:FKBP-type peptidyl-prolyl cis-trans isomerase [Tessaracoccus sp.]MBK7822008.1 FKBP-type peptidyl-prolyl cis-trans isomerase [Tessaracoccus sp.]
MKTPTRLLLSLGLSAGLILTGCSTPEKAPSAQGSGSVEDGAATGGSCAATGTAPSAPAVDEAASQKAIDAVTIDGDAAAAPSVSFDASQPITSEVVRITDQGSGDTLAEGQLMTFNYLVCDFATGEKLHSTWGATTDDAKPETLVLTATTFGPTVSASLQNAKVGTRLLWGQPGLSAEQSPTGEATNPYLFVLSVTGTQTIPSAASGTEVKPTDKSLPAIAITDGKPTVTIPSSFEEPKELVVQPLIEGTGPVVETGQTLMVKYTGWLTDGTQFDSSWDREAPQNVLNFQVGAGGVIQGWDQGLVGQKVGSRVLLVIPADLAYGETDRDNIPANSTLIFVVDILTAS